MNHTRDRMERQKEAHAAKESDARAALGLAEQQWGALSEERERHARQQVSHRHISIYRVYMVYVHAGPGRAAVGRALGGARATREAAGKP